MKTNNENASRMSDIARMAGVSMMTVHRALHDYPGIKTETKKRILEMASYHNYRPNALARAMRKGRFGCIGLAIGPADLEIAAVIGIFRILNDKGINLVFAEIPYEGNDIKKLVVPRLFSENMVDGLIIHAGILRSTGIPKWIDNPNVPSVVIIGNEKMNCVMPDFEAIIPDAFDRLLDLGYERVVYFGPVKAPYYHYSYMIHQIFNKWKGDDGMHQCIANDSDIPEDVWADKLSSGMKHGSPLTAYVTPSLFEARRCHAIAIENGRKIPEEAGILAFTTRVETSDSGRVFSGYRYSSFEIGEGAAKLILSRIANHGINKPSLKIRFREVRGETLTGRMEDK